MKKSFIFIAVLLFAGCTDENFKPSSVVQSEMNKSAPVPSGDMTSGGKFAAGKALEVLNSGGYTYVKVNSGGKEIWGAGPFTVLKVGDYVKFELSTPMFGFQSKTLNKTFDAVYFAKKILKGKVSEASGASGAENTQVDAHKKSTSKKSTPVAVTVSKMEKAKGGKTVAEVFAEKAALSNKKVLIRAKVVKYNPAIMGKNWIHIQDGTGAAGTNDLVVTSMDTAEIGDIIFVEGKVITNKDFGSGYSFDVMIEEAKLLKKQP